MKFLEKIFEKVTQTNLRVFVFFALIWLGLCASSGILFSEFHFEDDHMIEIHEDVNLSKQSVLETFVDWQTYDLSYRFRPISYIPIIIQSKLFGLNFPWWYISFVFFGILTCYFLYRCCILLRYTKGESFLFTFFVTGGIQTVSYWHLGYSEPQGLLMLSIALFYMIKSCLETQKRTINTILFIAFTILSSISKESFVLLIPALIFWYIWFQGKYNQLSFFKSLTKNYIPVLILGVTLLFELYMIKLIGTNKISYAGFDVNFLDPSKIWDLVNVLWFKNFLFLIPLFVFISMIIVKETRTNLKKTFINHLPILLLTLFIILPQFILYFKMGINERYLIPAIVGAAFLNIYLIHQFRSSQKFTIFFKYTLNGIIVIILLLNVYRFSVRTYLYAEEGKETKQFLNSIVKHSNPTSVLVIVGHPIVGWASSLAVYLNSIPVNRNNVYLKNMFLTDIFTPVEEGLIKKDMTRCFRNKTFEMIKDTGKIEGVMVYERLEKDFLKTNAWFHIEKFERLEYGRNQLFGKEAYGKMIFYYKKT